MNFQYACYGLQFNDYLLFDEKVCLEVSSCSSAKRCGKGIFSLERYARLRQCNFEGILINLLNKSKAHLVVDFVETANDGAGRFFKLHFDPI